MSVLKIVYIVGKIIKWPEWDFQGVFSTKDLAEDACLTDQYFIGPAEMNKEIPDHTVEWPECYYPKQKEGDSNL